MRGVGTFAVFVEGGSARVVRLSRRRPRSEALFHLSAEPLVLAELLAGERDKVRALPAQGRSCPAGASAPGELAPLADARLSLADAVKAGARLEPGARLPRAAARDRPRVDARATRSRSRSGSSSSSRTTWHVSARDGLPLRVVERRTEARADATVTMSRAAFERMLRNEPRPLGDRPQIRGDRAAVAALKRWTDLARGT